jgi:hypothetical protein
VVVRLFLTFHPVKRGASPPNRWCANYVPRRALPGDLGLLPRIPKGSKFVKIAIVIMLAAVAGTFLALCFYVVHRTGSVEGLADIGNTTLLSVVVAALAVAGGVRRK